MITTDAYGTLIIEFQGADLETRTARIFPETMAPFGIFTQNPMGHIEKYYRPNPDSTEGLYSLIAFSGGYQGSTLPYVPSVVIKLYLPENSTQSSAYIFGGAEAIAITNRKLFMLSLRKVLGIKGKIDPKLLEYGSVALTEEE